MKLFHVLFISCLVGFIGCAHPLTPDHPRLIPQVRMINDIFRSQALASPMHLRIIVPRNPPANQQLPVVYLLHGAGANYQDWSNFSNIASFAAHNIVLVMPDADNSFYINEAHGTHRAYEDYLINEVIPEVHRQVPNASSEASLNAIVGISRGGYGAAVLALKHPQIFSFIGDLSGALDFPERPFRPFAPIDSAHVIKAFGFKGSPTRVNNDPYILLAQVTPHTAPYIYIACGDRDLLLPANRRFADQVAAQHLPAETHVLHGGHDWFVWDGQLPFLESALLKHFHQPASVPQ